MNFDQCIEKYHFSHSQNTSDEHLKNFYQYDLVFPALQIYHDGDYYFDLQDQDFPEWIFDVIPKELFEMYYGEPDQGFEQKIVYRSIPVYSNLTNFNAYFLI